MTGTHTTSTDSTVDRESLPVELVDEQGRPAGICPVSDAHTAPGRLHRAFSVLLFGPDGRVLLQQRAAVKTRFPLRWSNTCCGHPKPGQSLAEAAAVRLGEELRIGAELREVGVYRYRADDPATGRVEDEWDHVLIGEFTGVPGHPDPAEVAALRWADPDRLDSDIDSAPADFTPWLHGVLATARAGR
ncbi:isopentenyl-diphosphate Delta-isomerase [Nocardia cerradoensis]|uniref:Isopentenyl-diphosphate Delta-isomerase n=1 Tax=Nocardia cerradoensis TaxID=85688 RepID=A0A231H6H0_9NOCA|nr:isopentenyl-diphosphate Delta-isomerase [Nocardia cerradoensis]OXR44316.1 Isopentenyl-diphosphate Delta-isomerase [Nocardia cerradoensis]